MASLKVIYQTHTHTPDRKRKKGCNLRARTDGRHVAGVQEVTVLGTILSCSVACSLLLCRTTCFTHGENTLKRLLQLLPRSSRGATSAVLLSLAGSQHPLNCSRVSKYKHPIYKISDCAELRHTLLIAHWPHKQGLLK